MNPTYYLLACCGLALVPFALVWAASKSKVDPKWKDSGDLRSIVVHSIRAMSGAERLSLWRSRFDFVKEYGRGYEPIKPYSFRKPPANALDKLYRVV